MIYFPYWSFKRSFLFQFWFICFFVCLFVYLGGALEECGGEEDLGRENYDHNILYEKFIYMNPNTLEIYLNYFIAPDCIYNSHFLNYNLMNGEHTNFRR